MRPATALTRTCCALRRELVADGACVCVSECVTPEARAGAGVDRQQTRSGSTIAQRVRVCVCAHTCAWGAPDEPLRPPKRTCLLERLPDLLSHLAHGLSCLLQHTRLAAGARGERTSGGGARGRVQARGGGAQHRVLVSCVWRALVCGVFCELWWHARALLHTHRARHLTHTQSDTRVQGGDDVTGGGVGVLRTLEVSGRVGCSEHATGCCAPALDNQSLNAGSADRTAPQTQRTPVGAVVAGLWPRPHYATTPSFNTLFKPLQTPPTPQLSLIENRLVGWGQTINRGVCDVVLGVCRGCRRVCFTLFLSR
jgi:hypothetical protein